MAWLAARQGGSGASSSSSSSRGSSRPAATAAQQETATELALATRTELKRRAAVLLARADSAGGSDGNAAALAEVLGAFALLAKAQAHLAGPPVADGAGAAMGGAGTSAGGLAEWLLALYRACCTNAGSATAESSPAGLSKVGGAAQRERQWWQQADSGRGSGGDEEGSCPDVQTFVLDILCHALLLRFAAEHGIGGRALDLTKATAIVEAADTFLELLQARRLSGARVACDTDSLAGGTCECMSQSPLTQSAVRHGRDACSQPNHKPPADTRVRAGRR
jgi:hypothetical protein